MRGYFYCTYGLVFLVLLLCLSGGSQAFTQASIEPGYRALHLSIQGWEHWLGLQTRMDLGLSRTMGLEGTLAYTTKGPMVLHGGVKLRLTESNVNPMALVMGLYTNISYSWHPTVHVLMERTITSFFRLRFGAGISWRGPVRAAYWVGGDYSLTHNTALQGGLRKEYWQDGWGVFSLGLRSTF